MSRSTLLPVGMVIVIVFVILMTMTAARTNLPDVTGNSAYPHHICTTNRYCVGSICSDTPVSFVVYLSYADGQPRLDFPGWAPEVSMTETINGLDFESLGGSTTGVISIYKNRDLDITGTSMGEDGVVEHFASGSCSRRVSP